jgi:hypothetical protein
MSHELQELLVKVISRVMAEPVAELNGKIEVLKTENKGLRTRVKQLEETVYAKKEN